MFSTGGRWRWTSHWANCFSDVPHGRDRVPTRRMSMRKIKEVLRLRFELQLGQREIARACSISQGAVHNYLKKAAAAGIGWPPPEGWDEKHIEEHFSVIDIPSNGGSAPFLTFLRSTSSSSNIVI